MAFHQEETQQKSFKNLIEVEIDRLNQEMEALRGFSFAIDVTNQTRGGYDFVFWNDANIQADSRFHLLNKQTQILLKILDERRLTEDELETVKQIEALKNCEEIINYKNIGTGCCCIIN